MTMVTKRCLANSTARWVLAAALVGSPGLALAQQPAAPAGDAQRGAKLAYTCFGCHGIPDYRNAYPTYHVPKLGGQHEAYFNLDEGVVNAVDGVTFDV